METIITLMLSICGCGISEVNQVNIPKQNEEGDIVAIVEELIK